MTANIARSKKAGPKVAVAEVAAAVAGKGKPTRLTIVEYHEQKQKWAGRSVRLVKGDPELFNRFIEYGYTPKLGEGMLVSATPDSYALTRDHRMYAISYIDGSGTIHSSFYPSDTIIEVLDGSSYPKATLAGRGVLRHVLSAQKWHSNVGSDPEFFVVDSKGSLMPAFTFLPNKNAVRLPFYDGYQAEFNTQTCTCLEYFCSEHKMGMEELLRAARKVDPGAELSVQSVITVTQEELRSVDPRYSAFGCSPSLSAYDEKPLSVDPMMVPFRMAGGHMHFTMPSPRDKQQNIISVKALDAVLGVICVSLFQRYDDPRRRMYYGKAGEYRNTKYGLEYRTLSNAWLLHPATYMFVWEVARRVVGSSFNTFSENGFTWWDASEEEIRECINNCDVALAHKILERNNIAFEELLWSLPGAKNHNTIIWKDVVLKGIHNYLKTPNSVASAWGLLSGTNFGRGTAYHLSPSTGNLAKGAKL